MRKKIVMAFMLAAALAFMPMGEQLSMTVRASENEVVENKDAS